MEGVIDFCSFFSNAIIYENELYIFLSYYTKFYLIVIKNVNKIK